MIEEAGCLLVFLVACIVLVYYWYKHPPGGQKMNENQLAIDISKIEGKKVEVNIAQIKEVLKCTLDILSNYPDEEIVKLVKRHKK
jgi:hypothetical protein